MAIDPRLPCLIGVARLVSRPEEGEAPEPLVMWETVCRVAAEDCRSRAPSDVLDRVDSLQIVYCQSWQYDDPPARLADRLSITPPHRLYSGIGGTTPQVLVQNAAEAILRGESDLALITGAEALDTIRRLKKQGQRPAWSFKDPERKPFPFEAPFHPAEVAHDVFQAWLTFALWDVARRAHLAIQPDDYRAGLGRLFAPMTEVAAANPYVWFPRIRTADELATATPDNRMVGYPYTKYLVSVMDVDMAAALLVASHATADALGVPQERRVYLRGWCYATDPVYVAEHEPMWSSPAMAAASSEAVRSAGVGIDDIAHLDLYSCFPSSVHFTLDALGLGVDDRRGVTVTGGLPFSGGAGSDYMTHSIATMADVLRRDPGSYGLVSGVGMHMTKHTFGVYSTEPGTNTGPPRPVAPPTATRTIRDVATGPATIATYSVVHGRDGGAEWGLAVCDLPGGDRCYAKVLDADLLAELEPAELVGTKVELVPGEANVNVLRL